jgi:hypothetical protein
MMTERLQQAIQFIQAGKILPARDLLLEEVKENPGNLTAWLWALEVAATDKERRLILQKILSIDPDHQAALSYLKKLDGQERSSKNQVRPDQTNQTSGSAPAGNVSRLSGILGLIVDWAATLPSGCFIMALVFSAIAGIFIYTRVNTGLFGPVGADFDNLVISNSYQQIASEEYTWEVQFEGIGDSKFKGTVRHVGPIRIQEFAILTHDILITSGDFADPDIVTTNVIDHKFVWKSPNNNSPSGSINLIHALPANKEIYQKLLEIDKWDTVKITGREIFTLKTSSKDGTLLGTWQDAGCNTLLVESVIIVQNTVED